MKILVQQEGGRVSGYRMENSAEVELILDDKPHIKTFAYVTILPREMEAIISDRPASELGITLLDPWKGHWCLREELGTKQRSSIPSEEGDSIKL